MKILIIETVPKAKNPIDAHARNTIEIKIGLIALGHRVDVAYMSEDLDKYDSDYQIIMVSYGTAFPEYINLENLVEKNKNARWGWITNEYNLSPNGMFHKIFTEKKAFILCNYVTKEKGMPWATSKYTVNLNTLLYKEFPKATKTHRIIYWGTYRTGREKYFKQYLKDDIYLSSSSKNFKKYLHIGCKPKFINKIDWRTPLISRFMFSLYIEDEYTHTNYNHLANRYYEALGCDTVTLFDENCISTLRKSEIDDWEDSIITPETVGNFNENDYKKLIVKQSKWKAQMGFNKEKTIKEIESALKKEAKQ